MADVEINNTKSDVLETSIGMPRGSVLGLLLYTIYVNDFTVDNYTLFADDTSLLISDSKIKHMVGKSNAKFSQAHEWFIKKIVKLFTQNFPYFFSFFCRVKYI